MRILSKSSIPRPGTRVPPTRPITDYEHFVEQLDLLIKTRFDTLPYDAEPISYEETCEALSNISATRYASDPDPARAPVVVAKCFVVAMQGGVDQDVALAAVHDVAATWSYSQRALFIKSMWMFGSTQ